MQSMGRAEPVSKKRKRPDTASDAEDATRLTVGKSSTDKGKGKASTPTLSFAKPTRKRAE